MKGGDIIVCPLAAGRERGESQWPEARPGRAKTVAQGKSPAPRRPRLLIGWDHDHAARRHASKCVSLEWRDIGG